MTKLYNGLAHTTTLAADLQYILFKLSKGDNLKEAKVIAFLASVAKHGKELEKELCRKILKVSLNITFILFCNRQTNSALLYLCAPNLASGQLLEAWELWWMS